MWHWHKPRRQSRPRQYLQHQHQIYRQNRTNLHRITTRASRRAPPALSAAAEAAWATDTLAGLAESGTTLADGTEVFVGRIAFAADGPAFAADGPAFTLPGPPDEGDPPDFASLVAGYGDVLGGPPPGLPPDRGPEFELRIETGSHPMPRSRPMKRWSQGELDECRKQVAFLLDQGWIVPSRASHAASVVFARKADGTWRFCQDYRGLNATTQRTVDQLPHVDQLVYETRGARFFSKVVPRPPGGPIQDVIPRARWSERVSGWRLRLARHVVAPYAVHALHFWPPRFILRLLRPGRARPWP